MRFPMTVGVLVACGLVVAAPVPKGKEMPKKDEDAIRGTWQVELFDAGGALVPPGAQTIRFAFEDGNLDVSMTGQPKAKRGRYKLDPTAEPKAIDLIEGTGEVARGIYELGGDTLKICLADGPNAVRPGAFKSDGKLVMVVTFKRMAEKVEKKDR